MEEPERCPWHPDVEPVQVVVNVVHGHQAEQPTRLITEMRCPLH